MMSVDLALPLLVLALVLVSLVQWLVIAKPWQLKGLSWTDRVRVGDAVNRYDFWASLFGLRRSRRTDRRDELRGNLWEAALRDGGRNAVRAIGPAWRLAGQGQLEPTGPRWSFGAGAGLLGVVVTAIVQFLLATVWFDAAQASGASRVDGAISLVPGMEAFWSAPGVDAGSEGMAMGLSLGPAPLLAGLVVFALAARPWRLVRRPVSV